MAISVTSIGVNHVASGNATLTSVTVPAHSLIIGVSTEGSGASTGPGAFSDGVNTWHTLTSVVITGNAGRTLLAYAFDASLSAGTITWTPFTSSDRSTISCCYATGIQTSPDPSDSAVTNALTATGTGASQNIISGTATPSQAGELYIAMCGIASLFNTTTVGGGFAPPPNAENVTSQGTVAGNLVNAGQGNETFTATVPNGIPFGACMGAFKAALPFALSNLVDSVDAIISYARANKVISYH